MEQTTTAPPSTGRFARDSEPPEPPLSAPAPAPPVNLAAVRTIQRRWPRTLPEKRIFPRG
jgi:hypothetical protein